VIGILVDDLHRAEEGRLRRYFLRRLRNAADAADATQETFLRFLSAPQTTIIENPQAYLFQIAKSVASRTTMRASAEARLFLPAEAGLNEPLDAPSQ
jgi:RNA polymerase sigma-70 factor (ECF subfamily)